MKEYMFKVVYVGQDDQVYDETREYRAVDKYAAEKGIGQYLLDNKHIKFVSDLKIFEEVM
ncbi:hypothetical protein assk_122 [Aeromonas phage Assk]|uniref:Uncharacterized protein n=5 Tax=Caudoviricetes TaxID=2731619 RepID=A0A291LDV9_9CAUD|nr:hypothetical protein [Aeromonas phage AS-szw]QAX98916.1 hypothetical protein assk_122 [Aeromonas phage Assk]